MSKKFYEILLESPRIISYSGMNWGTLYQVSPEEKEQLTPILKNKQLTVTERIGCIGLGLAHVMEVRHWFNHADPRYLPSISEKKWLIEQFEEAIRTDMFTGIVKSGYPRLLETIRSLPDIEDRLEYSIRYHV